MVKIDPLERVRHVMIVNGHFPIITISKGDPQGSVFGLVTCIYALKKKSAFEWLSSLAILHSY